MLHTGGNIKFSGGLPENNSKQNTTTTITTSSSSSSAAKLFSIVNNNLTVVNLQKNATQTLETNNSTVSAFDVSPDGDLVFAVGGNGLGIFYSISAGLALDTVSVPPNCPVRCAVFSPCSRYVALGADATLQIYAAPAERTVSFHGCHRIENVHNAVNDAINHIEWTADSSCVLVSGADARIRVYPRDVRNRIGWAAAVNNLIGHRAPVVATFWADMAPGTQVRQNKNKKKDDKNEEQEEEEQEEEEDRSTMRCISISTDNVVIEWHRSQLRRKEVMEMIWQMKRRSQIQKKNKNKKNRNKNKKNDGNDGDDNEDDEEDDDDDDDEDEDVVPQSFLEREKQSARAAEGSPEEAVKHHVTKGSDEHLPPAIRYAYETHKRHLLQHKGTVASAAYHRTRSLLAIGYTTGLFAIHAVLIDDKDRLDEDAAAAALASATDQQPQQQGTTTSTSLPLLHVLSATAQSLSAAAFSPKGDLVAFGSAHLKQLLVWDWRGETHVLKEQSHYYDISCSALTSDGALIVSGGDDGKAKVWRRSSGQCVASFGDHMGGITGIATSPATSAFFTSSKDGTCRGFDLVRYRNFRVFQASDTTQFSCIAVDSSGEVLAAGSATTGTITLWSVQTGKIVEEFSAHEGPISTLAFHASGSCLYSGAVDKQLIVWDLFNTASGQQGAALQSRAESQTMPSEVLCASSSLNGARLGVIMLNGECHIFDSVNAGDIALVTSFNTLYEAAGGWAGRVGPKSSNANSHFTTIALTPDGKKVLAGGESRWIALFHADHGYLMHKWPVTTNVDVLGVSEQFDFRNSIGNGEFITDIQIDNDDPHIAKRKLVEMPGSKHSHFATGKRKTQLAARAMHVAFAGHGRDFVAATTVGLLLFSADAMREKFAPLSLRRDLTTESVLKMLRSGGGDSGSKKNKHNKNSSSTSSGQKDLVIDGLIGALILQDESLIQEGLRRVPPGSVALVVDSVPTAAFPRLVRAVADALSATDALEHALLWAKNVMLFTSEPLFGPLRSDEVALPLRQLHKAVASYEGLRAAFNENDALLTYLSSVVNRRSRDALAASLS